MDYLMASSCFILHQDTLIRRKLNDMFSHRHYDLVMSIFVIFNMVVLAIDPPIERDFNSDQKWYLQLFITSIFLSECILKIFAFGFINNKFDS